MYHSMLNLHLKYEKNHPLKQIWNIIFAISGHFRVNSLYKNNEDDPMYF